MEECRALEVGELCDAGRWQSQPGGEILWCARHDGATLARLTYAIREQENTGGGLLMTYSYWPQGEGGQLRRQATLAALPGRRTFISCPGCGRRVRTLYVPLGQSLWRCRSCWGTVYRRSQAGETLNYVAEVAAPTIKELTALPRRTRRRPRSTYIASPPAELAHVLEEELPLGMQELRFWCLRLRAAGLSYRQIAALTESSKSSVQRICVGGRTGIDTMALVRERLERASYFPAPQGDDPRALKAYLGALHHHALRLGLYRHPLSQSEERVVIPADSAAAS